jgi:hypothetical protein
VILQNRQAVLKGEQTFLRLAPSEQVSKKVARVSQLLSGNPKFVLLSRIKLSKSLCFLYDPPCGVLREYRQQSARSLAGPKDANVWPSLQFQAIATPQEEAGGPRGIDSDFCLSEGSLSSRRQCAC